MAYGKKRTYRKRRRPSYRKKRRKTRKSSGPGRYLALKPAFRTAGFSDDLEFTNNSIVEFKWGQSFMLSAVTNYTNFTNLFDSYRIRRVYVKFTPTLATSVNRPYDDTTAGTAVTQTPRICVAIDRDDSTTPPDFESLRERQGSRVFMSGKSHSLSFTPTRLRMLYDTPSTTAYAIDTETSAWIDCSNPNVPHYGLKVVQEIASPNAAWYYKMSVTYALEFRARRV